MKITDFLNVKGIKLDLESTEKEGVLQELVDILAEIKDIDIYRAVIGAVEKLANKEWTKKMSFEIVDTKKKKEEGK